MQETPEREAGGGEDPGEGGGAYTARVMKGGEGGPASHFSLNRFHWTPFHVPGRLPPGLTREEVRIRELQRLMGREKEKARAAAEAAVRDRAEARREAHAQGFAQGEAKAGERFEGEIARLRKELSEAMAELSAQKRKLFHDFEEQAVGLAMACARKLFGHLAGQHEGAIRPVLKSAVASLGRASPLVVKLNPADIPQAESGRADWLPMDAGAEDVRIIGDGRIARGCCLVECEGASTGVDYRSVAEAMEEELQKALSAEAREDTPEAP